MDSISYLTATHAAGNYTIITIYHKVALVKIMLYSVIKNSTPMYVTLWYDMYLDLAID